MEENIVIRNEKKEDWETVEKITRQAFYNLYVPGCVEHYLVHIMREHEDFIPELDFVLELDGQVIGNIIYTKAKLIVIREWGMEKCLWSIHSNQPYSQDMIRLLSLEVLSTMSAVDSKAAKNIMSVSKVGNTLLR